MIQHEKDEFRMGINVLIVIIITIFSSILFYLLMTTLPDILEPKRLIKHYTYNNNIFSFTIDDNNTKYELSLPSILIKDNDKVEIRYAKDRGHIIHISSFYINDKSIDDNVNDIDFKEVK